MATQHNATHKGLQNHSIGTEYPWTISKRGGYWYAWNTITGERGRQSTVYRDCENWIQGRKNIKRERNREPLTDVLLPDIAEIAEQLRKEFQPLEEWTILVPVLRNDNRQPHCPTVWEWLETSLVCLFDGFTCGESVTGTWIDSQGSTVSDVSRIYRVACLPDSVSNLRELLPAIKRKFGQETLYLAQTSTLARIL